MAPDTALTRAAERLINRHLDSVGALDLLLLMHSTRDRDWDLSDLCLELSCPERWATGQLERLTALGIVAQTAAGRYRYGHGNGHAVAVDEVARACRRNRPTVTKLIFAKPARPARSTG